MVRRVGVGQLNEHEILPRITITSSWLDGGYKYPTNRPILVLVPNLIVEALKQPILSVRKSHFT
jgi:hypothetical protein